MKKVLHIVISENYREGDSYHHNVLSQKHKEMGYDVYIIARNKFRDREGREVLLSSGEYINPFGIKVTTLPTNNYHRFHIFFDTCRGLYDAICKIEPDIIFSHNFGSRDVRHIKRYVKKHPATKFFVDCHSDYYNTPVDSFWAKLYTFLVKQNVKLINQVVLKFWGTTPWRVDYLKDVYKVPAEKADLLIMGASEELIIGKSVAEVRSIIRKRFNIPQDAFLIITGGKLDKRKNQISLLEAVKCLSDTTNTWLLVFGTPTDEMKPEFAKYNNVNNIVQAGWLPSEEAYDLFLASDLAFFPGTHSVLWEQAAACGVPLAVKHWPRIEHVNINGNAVFLEETDSLSIQDAILSIKDEKVYPALKSKANEVASCFYAINNAKKAIGED